MAMNRLTVGQLKEIIKDLPDDTEVVIADSEWGDECASEAEIRIIDNDYKKETYLRIA
jgi:hypothetical protein